jgi:hypothetical protein
MIDDDLSDTAELELLDTDVMEQLPDAAAEPGVMCDGLAGCDAPTDDESKELESKRGFDPYNHS